MTMYEAEAVFPIINIHRPATGVEQQIIYHQSMIESLIARAEKEDKYGFLYEYEEDDHVVFFRLAFAPMFNKYYTYAAIRTNELWYSTGPKAPKGFTTAEMIKWWTDNDVQEVHVAIEWEVL